MSKEDLIRNLEVFQKQIRVIKENLGILIATTFSMIIFLLSFLPSERRLFGFDLGISFLLISALILLRFFLYLSNNENQIIAGSIQDFKTITSRSKIEAVFESSSITCFKLGLAFLIINFQLYYLLIIIIIEFVYGLYINLHDINKMRNPTQKKVRADQQEILTLQKELSDFRLKIIIILAIVKITFITWSISFLISLSL